MSTSPTLEEQLASVISYGRRQDLSYRSGMVLQVVGAGILAVLYPMGNPFYSAGIMVFDLGVLLSGIFLLVWMSLIKRFVLGAILVGIPLQIAGLYAPPEYAGTIIITGIGLVCAAAAAMAGKEAYCFGWREGRILKWSLPAVVVLNLIARENRPINSLAFSAIFILFLSLTGKKLRQPTADCRHQTDRAQTTAFEKIR